MNEEKNCTLRDKKRFLNQFYWISKELENLEEKLKKLTIKIEGIKTTNFSSMPKGGQHQDITDLLAQKEKYQLQLAKKMTKIENIRSDIESSIDTLEDSRLRLILRYKYLENYSYKEIAADLRKSERHIRRLHDIAIRIMEIIKK